MQMPNTGFLPSTSLHILHRVRHRARVALAQEQASRNQGSVLIWWPCRCREHRLLAQHLLHVFTAYGTALGSPCRRSNIPGFRVLVTAYSTALGLLYSRRSMAWGNLPVAKRSRLLTCMGR